MKIRTKIRTPKGEYAKTQVTKIADNCNHAYELYERLGYNGNPSGRLTRKVSGFISDAYSRLLRRSRRNRTKR